MDNRDSSSTNIHLRDKPFSGQIVVTLKDYILVGIGGMLVLTMFFTHQAIYYEGYKDGQTEERLTNIESVLTGQGLNKKEALKWLQSTREQKRGG